MLLNLFSEECYGQFGLPCADAYFEYGSILFDLAQLEPGVVGVAFDGSEEALQCKYTLFNLNYQNCVFFFLTVSV